MTQSEGQGRQFQSVVVECFEVATDFGVYNFIVLYRPTEFNVVSQDYTTHSCDCLRYLCDAKKSGCNCGNLNLPHIYWSAIGIGFFFFQRFTCNTVGSPWWVWIFFRPVTGQLFLQYFDAVGWVF